MRHFDTFSGIGGFALAARSVGFSTVGFCEIEPFCQKVLAKNFPGIPIHNDIRDLDYAAIGSVDLITGGYPCQPFSLAGARKGVEDERHLWPALRLAIRCLSPKYVVCENVFGHLSMGLDEVWTDLERLGYTVETFIIPAAACDAPHRRDRVWIIAYADSGDESGLALRDSQGIPVADADSERHVGRSIADVGQWPAEPGVGRVADGIPNRVDRLKGLGNAIVPAVAQIIFEAITERERWQ